MSQLILTQQQNRERSKIEWKKMVVHNLDNDLLLMYLSNYLSPDHKNH